MRPHFPQQAATGYIWKMCRLYGQGRDEVTQDVMGYDMVRSGHQRGRGDIEQAQQQTIKPPGPTRKHRVRETENPEYNIALKGPRWSASRFECK